VERQALYVKKIVIIGGGLGGLSCAIRLAAHGCKVRLLEKEPELGGKLKKVVGGKYSFDMGPSTITMVDAFKEVFTAVGRRMEDYLQFYPVHPMTKNFFPDGSVVNLSQSIEEMEEQISQYSKEDASRYRDFLKESEKLYTISQQQFLNRLLPTNRDLFDFQLLKSFASIKPFTTLHQMLRNYFKHPNTLAMFGRYATYVGSSPYRAPAIFSMMASLEGQGGIYGVKGGTYSIVEAFEKLAGELGVDIKKNINVARIKVVNKRVVGVETTDGFFEADQVIANGDALAIYKNLIDEADRPSITNRRIDGMEPSLSGFVMLLGMNKRIPILTHHNVFFSKNYKQEFTDIFEKKMIVEDPTIYICYSGYSQPELVGENNSNLFVLVNAPYTSSRVNWDDRKESYFLKIITKLESRGLKDLIGSIDFYQIMTPADLQERTGAHRGAIYGTSSNSFQQAFFKLGNKSKDIEGLWFVGGSAHPGGGTPIVTKSGQLVAKAIIESI
jgi:diapolycopene oxygenase